MPISTRDLAEELGEDWSNILEEAATLGEDPVWRGRVFDPFAPGPPRGGFMLTDEAAKRIRAQHRA